MDSVSPTPPAAHALGRSTILVYLLADPVDQQISEAILKHLKPIVRNFPLPIEVDSDFSVPPGADRDNYELKLFDANIVLALISSDFIDNDALYARNQKVMERHNRGQTIMIPLLVRNCMWKRTPFARLDVLPRNSQPLNNKQYWNSQDDAIMAVVEDIDRSLNELAQRGAIQLSPAAGAKSASDVAVASAPPAVRTGPSSPAKPVLQSGAEPSPSAPAAKTASDLGAGSAAPRRPAAAAAPPSETDWRRKYYWGVFWKRGLALFLDYLLAGVLTAFVVMIFGGQIENSDGSASAPTIAIFLIIFYLLCPFMESRWRATFGKMIAGLQITDKDGNRISFWRAFRRNVLRSAAFYLYCFVAPAIYQYFRFRQTRKLFHDEWSHTVMGERLKSAKPTMAAAAPAE
jgi:uncharacterized RDD family membrane protein YckC